GMTIDALAVDRTKNTAVLLPPFHVSREANEMSALRSLYDHAMSRAHTFEEQQLIHRAWSTTVEGLER
ncbi:MAG: hypothetical protein JWP13_836, partial [Candidatus Saccharibacteria bacterium]|nr:hypothetical protein [Candidatus Saccharibacteria bacterium]